MKKNYNVKIVPHRRTSLVVDSQEKVGFPVVVLAKNKTSAKELAQAMVRDYYNGNDYMVQQYKYIVDVEE